MPDLDTGTFRFKIIAKEVPQSASEEELDSEDAEGGRRKRSRGGRGDGSSSEQESSVRTRTKTTFIISFLIFSPYQC